MWGILVVFGWYYWESHVYQQYNNKYPRSQVLKSREFLLYLVGTTHRARFTISTTINIPISQVSKSRELLLYLVGTTDRARLTTRRTINIPVWQVKKSEENLLHYIIKVGSTERFIRIDGKGFLIKPTVREYSANRRLTDTRRFLIIRKWDETDLQRYVVIFKIGGTWRLVSLRQRILDQI